jgi:hypothetical protein
MRGGLDCENVLTNAHKCVYGSATVGERRLSTAAFLEETKRSTKHLTAQLSFGRPRRNMVPLRGRRCRGRSALTSPRSTRSNWQREGPNGGREGDVRRVAAICVADPWPRVIRGRRCNAHPPAARPRREGSAKEAPDVRSKVDAGGCGSAAQLGGASAATPILPAPPKGTVYIVSQGGHLPKLMVPLSGNGIGSS